MAILDSEFMNQVANKLARDTKEVTDLECLEELVASAGAEAAKEHGMDPSLYYLYLHLLKWNWETKEIGDFGGAYCIKLWSPYSNRYKTFILGKAK